MSTMERILRLMGEKKASDVYLSAHAPALIKINGQCLPINNQLLPPDAPKALLAEVNNLVEYPVGIVGSFDERFLEVPEPVVVSAMRSHQRFLRGLGAGSGAEAGVVLD